MRCCPCLVAVAAHQRILDHETLSAFGLTVTVQGFGERELDDALGKMRQLDLATFTQQSGALHDVAQLANVARPTVTLQNADSFGAQRPLPAGVGRSQFAQRFGVDVADAFAEPVNRYVALGAMELSPSHLRITRRAMILADTVLADIVAAEDGQ